VQSATVGDAVEVLGFEKVPNVGGIIQAKISGVPAGLDPHAIQKPLKLELVYKKIEKHKGISIVLVADTQGSLEAIVNALPEGVRIVNKKTGEVTEADILLAKSTEAIVLSFNTKIKPDVSNFAYLEKVLLRNYEIIYELLDEIEDALEGKLLSQMEQIYGQAKILAKFPFEKTFAFGISVVEGRIARGDRLRVMRGEEVVGEVTISSLRVGKNSTSKVEKGNEAGIVFSGGLDMQVGDMILSHS
jgi:translation initiation factor IF-2